MPGIGTGLGIWMKGSAFSGGGAVPQWIASITKDHNLIWDNTEKWNSASNGFTSGFSSGYRYNL
jgi:hypothetical protein